MALRLITILGVALPPLTLTPPVLLGTNALSAVRVRDELDRPRLRGRLHLRPPEVRIGGGLYDRTLGRLGDRQARVVMQLSLIHI